MDVNLMKEGSDIVHKLCEEHNVRLIYIAYTGSNAYGYANSASDKDILFIYVRPAKDYFRVDPLPEHIKHPELNIKGWDLCKFLDIVSKSGWNAHEALYCPCTTLGDNASLMLDIANIASECIEPEKIAKTMVCCALRDYEKAQNNDIKKKVKYFLSFTRMILSAIYLIREKEYPFIKYDMLVDDIIKKGLLKGYHNLTNSDFTRRFLQFVRAARSEEREEMIDIDILNAFMTAFKDIHAKLTEELTYIDYKSTKIENIGKINNIISSYILSKHLK